VDAGVQLYVVPVKPLAIVDNVSKSLAGPFFNKRVTGPEAPAQEMLNGVPVETLTNCEATIVNCAALATAAAAAAMRTVENCILDVCLEAGWRVAE